MNILKKYLPNTIKGIIAFLFLLSAAAKLYPSAYFAISTFEFSQLYPMGFSEKVAPYFSRILIGIEFALGILILQKKYLKKLVIPAILLMLAIFTIHLCYVTYSTGGNEGNCGCFGSLLPMTPLQAIAKNLVAIILLVILYKNLPHENNKNHNLWMLLSVILACVLMLFMIAPIDHQKESNFTVSSPQETNIDSLNTQAVKITAIDKPVNDLKINSLTEIKKSAEIKIETQKSGYANFYPNIDQGRQILGFFVPGCDHCRQTVKQLTEMRKADSNFPKIQILFMDEETNLIPEFFSFAGAEYPYKVIGVIDFWKLLGSGKQVPGVKYIKDGKIIKYFYGTTGPDIFNEQELKKIL